MSRRSGNCLNRNSSSATVSAKVLYVNYCCFSRFSGRHVFMPGHIPVGGYGSCYRGKWYGGVKTGRRILRAHNRVRRATCVYFLGLLHIGLYFTIHPFDRGSCRARRHLTKTTKQVSLIVTSWWEFVSN